MLDHRIASPPQFNSRQSNKITRNIDEKESKENERNTFDCRRQFSHKYIFEMDGHIA